MWHVLIGKPLESLAGLGTLLPGLIVFHFSNPAVSKGSFENS